MKSWCVDMKTLFKNISHKVFEFLIIIYTNLGLGFRFELLLLMVPELRSFSVEFDLFVFLFLVFFSVEIWSESSPNELASEILSAETTSSPPPGRKIGLCAHFNIFYFWQNIFCKLHSVLKLIIDRQNINNFYHTKLCRVGLIQQILHCTSTPYINVCYQNITLSFHTVTQNTVVTHVKAQGVLLRCHLQYVIHFKYMMSQKRWSS